jgi:hypothetical protein
VGGGELGVLRGERRLGAREFAQRGLALAQALLARLLEDGEGLGDARDGGFVWRDVEVGDRVPDELQGVLVLLVKIRNGGGRKRGTYGRGVFFEEHFGGLEGGEVGCGGLVDGGFEDWW